ncbi:zinc ribbon domain-containing protein [Dyadobacter tibetensis]|uniref:zinc ribbon domain-containing protein n=1 Tax=Dyadobacter tibetensis TaxID=1211851 RepID=UPI00046ED370|nr:C4-type zinc ribbon domain-containing protein [Dyadobacter tibetensis]
MENTIAQKLDALLKLQEIDSSLDEIRKTRGDLPEEVRDLEDEIAGIETRLAKFKGEIGNLNSEIDSFKNAQKDGEKLIKKYKEQQMNVRNNREYDAITKEIELQELDMQLAEKKINEARARIRLIEEDLNRAETSLKDRNDDLKAKKDELDLITSESEADEKDLLTSREKHIKKIEERLLKSYQRIRGNSINGLAVVNVSRGACGGCFSIVPPQRQADIRERKKLIVCEHCGRILADVESVEPVTGRR